MWFYLKKKTVSNIDEGLTGNKYKRRYTDRKPLLSRAIYIYIILWGPGTSIFFLQVIYAIMLS